MKAVELDQIHKIGGVRIRREDTFFFQCHPDISCFNLCCRNLNLFLYPYDVLRMKNSLGISSDLFLEKYVDIVFRDNSFFPDVLLRMNENEKKTCPFLTDDGCGIYADRPNTCRWFPIETGVILGKQGREAESVYFFRTPNFCKGACEKKAWTIRTWSRDQEAETHHEMTLLWADLKRLFQNNPWGKEGPCGGKGKMAFMATYNIDVFRKFVIQSSFLKRYHVRSKVKEKIKFDDVQLMKLGFEWVKLFLWSIPSTVISPK